MREKRLSDPQAVAEAQPNEIDLNTTSREMLIAMVEGHVAALADMTLLMRKRTAALAAEKKRADEAQQALWDVYGILGFDQDGDKTPPKVTPPLETVVKNAAQEFRKDSDETEERERQLQARVEELEELSRHGCACDWKDGVPGVKTTFPETTCDFHAAVLEGHAASLSDMTKLMHKRTEERDTLRALAQQLAEAGQAAQRELERLTVDATFTLDQTEAVSIQLDAALAAAREAGIEPDLKPTDA